MHCRLHRLPLAAVALCVALATSAPAQADVIGASAKYHSGVIKTDLDTTWVTGAEAALQLFGFEIFADLRFLEGHLNTSTIESDWFWDRIGLRFDVGLPFTMGAEKASVFVDGSYLATRRPDPPTLDSESDREKPRIGLMAGAGVRFDYNLFWKFYFTLQPEVGIDFRFLNVDDPAPSFHASGLAAIKLDI